MKMFKSGIVFLFFAVLITGCAQPKPAVEDSIVLDGLNSVAKDVHSELRRLNEISNKPLSPQITTVKGCSSKVVSLEFDGDIMLFVEDLKKSNLCKVRLIGKKPQQDLILALHHKKVPLWQILEDASVQLGRMASITVSSETVLIQLNGGVQ
jgi:hypothetical protein